MRDSNPVCDHLARGGSAVRPSAAVPGRPPLQLAGQAQRGTAEWLADHEARIVAHAAAALLHDEETRRQAARLGESVEGLDEDCHKQWLASQQVKKQRARRRG
jgi:hypothetical protein